MYSRIRVQLQSLHGFHFPYPLEPLTDMLEDPDFIALFLLLLLIVVQAFEIANYNEVSRKEV